MSSSFDFYKNDTNPFQNAVEDYYLCYKSYLTSFPNFHEFKKEESNPDLKFVCKKELENLRSVAAGIGYKEVIGSSVSSKIPFYKDTKIEF